MPELPEVEIAARRLGAAVRGEKVASAVAAGVGTLKSYDPPLSALAGRTIEGVGRRGKHLLIEFSGELVLLVHLMSAGRLQAFDRPGSPRDRRLRLGMRLADGREVRLREFGTRQSAWAKLLRAEALEAEPALAGLGPEAWPDPPPFAGLLAEPRPLHALLRDQKVIAGIGRSWVDEILHGAGLPPFKRGDTLTDAGAADLREVTLARLGEAIDHYERAVGPSVPDRLPMPLTVHRRKGEPCPRCGTAIAAVHFEDHDLCYCPTCQTGGRLLKDRRLSRLLK